jgi:hypothetical protein
LPNDGIAEVEGMRPLAGIPALTSADSFSVVGIMGNSAAAVVA